MLMRGFSGASRVQRVFQWNLNETKLKTQIMYYKTCDYDFEIWLCVLTLLKMLALIREVF